MSLSQNKPKVEFDLALWATAFPEAQPTELTPEQKRLVEDYIKSWLRINMAVQPQRLTPEQEPRNQNPDNPPNTQPLCAPDRASMLSRLFGYPHGLGCGDVMVLRNGYSHPMRKSGIGWFVDTLSKVFDFLA
jgi:hypothetical protein